MLISRSQIVAIEKDLASGHGPNSEVIARPTVRPHSERTGGQRKTPPLPEDHPVDPALRMFKRGDPHRGATHAPTAGPAADPVAKTYVADAEDDDIYAAADAVAQAVPLFRDDDPEDPHGPGSRFRGSVVAGG